MTLLCVVCPTFGRDGEDNHPKPRRPNVPNVCDADRERLAGDLAALPDAYYAVPDHLYPSPAGGERHSIGYESRPPVNISALSLLGPGEGTPLAVMATWAMDWATYLREAGPVNEMTAVCQWLGIRLDWACSNHPAVDEFAAALSDVLGQLRPFQSAKVGEPAGRCPRRPGDQRCKTPLYVDPYDEQAEIVCPRCKSKWKRGDGEWIHLRAQQIAAGVEAA